MTNVLNKWKTGLSKTSKAAFGQIATILGATEITPDSWEDIEATLIQADLGLETTDAVLEALEHRVDTEGLIKTTDFINALREVLRSFLDEPQDIQFVEQPFVIMIVGVNGSGKTTTIAKLGHIFNSNGKSAILGAADTYRAAAVDQLEIWANRLDLPIISGQPGLHTRFNLMEELKKVYKVIGKAMPDAPHAVWLVMDATTGQNAIQQARAFKDAVKITGVILAKLDSSAKGGMAFAIQRELGNPILYAGLGESQDDLQVFNPDAFIDGIMFDLNQR
jgi:fused signal recognition particle receptor